jgi:hypothetical protein
MWPLLDHQEPQKCEELLSKVKWSLEHLREFRNIFAEDMWPLLDHPEPQKSEELLDKVSCDSQTIQNQKNLRSFAIFSQKTCGPCWTIQSPKKLKNYYIRPHMAPKPPRTKEI